MISPHETASLGDDVDVLLAKLSPPQQTVVLLPSVSLSCSVSSDPPFLFHDPVSISPTTADVSLMKSKVPNFSADDLFKEPLTSSENSFMEIRGFDQK